MSASRTDDETQLRYRAKLTLRKQMRAVREALPATACDTRSTKAIERVLELDAFREASVVLAFASIRNEVRTRELMEAVWSAGRRLVLPRVVDEELELRLVARETALVEGAFSVPEPPGELERVEPGEIDFALVPALAIDARGYRIGYGGGYYDRLLPQLANAATCAIAYDFQLIAEMPELPFDVAVDWVVTDERLIRAG